MKKKKTNIGHRDLLNRNMVYNRPSKFPPKTMNLTTHRNIAKPTAEDSIKRVKKINRGGRQAIYIKNRPSFKK